MASNNNYNIPEKMKAVVLTGPNEYSLQMVPVPKAGPGEVLCKIGAVAICGSDPGVFDGHLLGEWPPKYPFIAGHEWAGRVVAVGEGVTKFKPGDRVAGEAHRGCGQCVNCKAGRYTLCLNYGKTETGHRHYGFITNGAYAQYCNYFVESLTPLDDSISYAEAAMCDTAGVALHGIEIAGINPGGTIAVIGPGPIGVMVMKIARAMGAARVIVIGRGSRLKSAGNMGFHELVDFTKTDPVEVVRNLTGQIGVDCCFECSGAEKTLSQAIRMVKKGGKVVLLGVPSEERDEPVPFKLLAQTEIMVSGSKANPNVSYKVLELIKNKNIYVKDMITHRFQLENIREAMDTFINRKDNVMKVVLYPNGGEDI